MTWRRDFYLPFDQATEKWQAGDPGTGAPQFASFGRNSGGCQRFDRLEERL